MMNDKEKISFAINQIAINNCDGSANEKAIKAVRLLQEVHQALIIPCVSNLLFCGICEEENEHRTLPDGSLECEGCGNIAKL